MIYNWSKLIHRALKVMALFSLLACGYHYVHEDGLTIDRPDGPGVYAFVFFKSTVEVLLDGRMAEVEPNHFILYRPDARQLYRGKPLVNDWMHFEAQDGGVFLSGLPIPMNVPVKAPNPVLVSHCIMGLQNTKHLGGPFCERIIDTDIQGMMLRLCNNGGNDDLPETSCRYIRQFTELRNAFYGVPRAHYSVDELAEKVHLSKSYFQHVYRELFGCAVMDDVINGRLEYAQFLLNNSTLDVCEISEQCGYKNYVHFMRQFKKRMGITPGAFRAQAHRQAASELHAKPKIPL